MAISISSPASDKLVGALKARAETLGFDAFGIARAHGHETMGARLDQALAQSWHGGMDWMAATAARRRAPGALWPQARSLIALGMSYAPDHDPIAQLAERAHGNISAYARNRDYHELIKGRLKELAGLLARRSGANVKVFVDTAPLMEKPLAEAAGIGWQGKHTVLVSRRHGSWMFLGAILTDAELPADTPHAKRCGTCRRCLDVCPTDAFPAPYQLDARRCLAYYSVEHFGPIPRAYRAPMGNRVFGCDDCLAVCPWNRFATVTREAKLRARADLAAPALAELAALDDAGFRALFAGSPVKRLGSNRFMRNVLIAIGNSDDCQLAASARAQLDHADPAVRGAAIWALRRLLPMRELTPLRAAQLAVENDDTVRAEWSGPLTPAWDEA